MSAYTVPNFEKIPPPLRYLDDVIVNSLRVFDLDFGIYPQRHEAGFRRHGGILSLSWTTKNYSAENRRT